MKNTILLVFTVISVILLQSCATLLGGGRNITGVRNGYPANAKVYYNGNYIGEAPQNVKVDKQCKKGQCNIEIKQDGYETAKIEITRKVSFGYTILDICFGLFPLVIDFADGAIYKPRPNKVNYSLVQREGYKPVIAQKEEYKSAITYNFKTGDSIAFKNNSGKPIKGKVIGINDETALVEYEYTNLFNNKKKQKQDYFTFNKLTKLQSAEENNPKSIDKPIVNINSEKQIYKVTSDLNMRTGAGVNYGKIMQISKGASVELIEKVNSEWWKIKYNDEIGFVSSKFLSK